MSETSRIVGAMELPVDVEAMSRKGRQLTAVFGDGLTMSQEGRGLVFRTPGPVCGCVSCHERDSADLRRLLDSPWWGGLMRTMIVCPDCGNKRCPKASHHDQACTGSNEPGQVGSVYA